MGDEKSTHPSLRPPLHGYSDPGEAPATSSWVLLDLYTYVADRENASSAYGEMSDGTRIRVTFCAAPPPLISYVCVWCPDLPPTEIALEPTVEAAESDLLLLEVSLRRRRQHSDYFVYKADGGVRGPSLRRLELPEPCQEKRYNVGLLARRDVIPRRPHGEGDGERVPLRLRPHGERDRHYYVAALNYEESHSGSEHCYNLLLFDSEEGQWRSLPVSVCGFRYHTTSKVIAPGEGGLLGFVDPWRGIIVCDVLGHSPPQYLPLPPELIRNDRFGDEPLLSRDVALVEGRLTLVELRRTIEPETNLNPWTWDVSTWSRKVTHGWEEDWRNDYNVHSPDISVGEDVGDVNLLPKMKDNEGTLRPTLGRLYTAHPALSLTDSHVVYVMGKVRRQEKKALVLSIDMKKLKLQGVAMFDAERMLGIAFSYTYTQSWIPKYFNPDVNENLKRPGNFRVPYPHKLPDRISMTYNELYMQLSGDVQEQHDTGACKGSEQEDDSMNLDYSCIKKGHE